MRVFCWIEIKKMEELIIGLLDRVGISFLFIYKPLEVQSGLVELPFVSMFFRFFGATCQRQKNSGTKLVSLLSARMQGYGNAMLRQSQLLEQKQFPNN